MSQKRPESAGVTFCSHCVTSVLASKTYPVLLDALCHAIQILLNVFLPVKITCCLEQVQTIQATSEQCQHSVLQSPCRRYFVVFVSLSLLLLKAGSGRELTKLPIPAAGSMLAKLAKGCQGNANMSFMTDPPSDIVCARSLAAVLADIAGLCQMSPTLTGCKARSPSLLSARAAMRCTNQCQGRNAAHTLPKGKAYQRKQFPIASWFRS